MTSVMSRRPARVRSGRQSAVPPSVPATPVLAPVIPPSPAHQPRCMPMAHMGFEGSRHLEPERLPSGRKERARTVRVIDLTQDTIESIKQIAEGLKRLDLSSLKLEELNEELLECCTGLERLDIGFNQLTDDAIPACFGKLDNLVELSAHYNKLTAVPKVLKKLKNISRLKLGHNELETIEGVERFKKLQVLVIENNKIETIPRDVYQNAKRLEMWHLSNNQLKEVHSDIRLLRYLRDLDVSGNNLTTLPPELFLLPRLEVLNASCNQIARLPTVNIKGNNRQHLQSLDLSDNQLIKFPEHLLLIAEKLDLSKNKIKVIPSNVIKKLDWGTDQQLNVSDNPLTNPPQEICECGLRSIMQFFQEAKTDMKVYQGLKILVLGAPGSGKTSLIQTLVDQQSRLTTAEEITSGMDMYDLSVEVEDNSPDVELIEEPPPPPTPSPVKEEPPVKKPLSKKKSKSGLKKKDRASVDSEEGSRSNSRSRKKSPEKQIKETEKPAQIEEVDERPATEEVKEPVEPPQPEKKSLQLAVWDFSGHSQYLYSNYFFVQQPFLVWLVFDISKYDDEKFSEQLGVWLDWIIAKTNHLVALVIGTHADKVRPKKAKSICETVREKVQQYLQNHKNSIEKEIKKIESRPHISPALSEQLKRYIGLLKIDLIVHPEVLAVSSKEMTEMDLLLEATKSMALNKEVYPSVLKLIPSLWSNVEYYMEDKGYAMQYHAKEEEQKLQESIINNNNNPPNKAKESKFRMKKDKNNPIDKKKINKQFKKVPIMTFDEYSEEITRKFGMKHLVDQITRYMHDTGKVMWFWDHPTLRDYVFLRPSWLSDLFKSLFRHDWAEADYTLEEAFKASNMSPSKIEKLKKELTDDGVADKDILKCLWSHLIPTDLNKPILEVISILLEHFELGYPIHRAGARETARPGQTERSDSSSTARSMRGASHDRNESINRADRAESQTTSSNTKKNERIDPPKVSRMLIPWLRATKQPKIFEDEYRQFNNNPSITAVFRFPKYTPPGFFETMSVRALRPCHDLTCLHHWSVGLHARHAAQFLRFYLMRITHDDGSTCIRVEIRSENALNDTQEKEEDVMEDGGSPDKKDSDGQDDVMETIEEEDPEERIAEVMWTVLLPYLKDAEDLIGKFAGARIERQMECPSCHANSFLGEWLTPKELQNVPHKQCDACKKDIPTCLLVQPKEKKKEEFLLQKLMRQAESRAEKTSSEEMTETPAPEPTAEVTTKKKQKSVKVEGDNEADATGNKDKKSKETTSQEKLASSQGKDDVDAKRKPSGQKKRKRSSVSSQDAT